MGPRMRQRIGEDEERLVGWLAGPVVYTVTYNTIQDTACMGLYSRVLCTVCVRIRIRTYDKTNADSVVHAS